MPKFFHNLQQHQRSTRVQQSWILAGFALTIIALLTRRPPFSFEQDDNTIRNLTSLYGMVEQSPQQQSSSSSSSSSSITTETTVPTHQPLCYQQSGGFFRDISDSNWKRLQEITKRTFPNHYTPDLMKYANHPTKQHSNWWNAENFQEEFHCQFAERLPSDSSGDGPKWVCDPHRIVQQYQNVTNNNNNMNDKNTNCLIYSVGSNGNVMFEKAVKQQISPDCEIHTFDMVTYNKRNGDFKEALEGYATFHDWGIGRPGPVEGGYLNSMTGNLKTLEETVKLLGHQGRRIDVFKIDCEQCEWYMYDEWLKSDVVELKQILVETHNAPMPHARNFFFGLHDAGYVIFSKEANYQNGGGGVEFGFLKLSPDFFIDNSLYKLQRNAASTTMTAEGQQ